MISDLLVSKDNEQIACYSEKILLDYLLLSTPNANGKLVTVTK